METLTSSPIRVMLVDDHAMVRVGLATILKVIDGMELVGEAADGLSAIQLCREIVPDIILMDMILPDINGVEATRVIRQEHPAVRVVALTSIESDELIQDALNAGAVGYLIKSVTTDELAVAIRAVSAGLDALSPRILAALIRNGAKQPSAMAYSLTRREIEVLALMVNGSGNTEIAKELVITPATVKSHVSSILNKLDVTSRTEAVALALRDNLIP